MTKKSLKSSDCFQKNKNENIEKNRFLPKIKTRKNEIIKKIKTHLSPKRP
jgi:hypothetical protein